jgi:hypothetical protein
MRRWLIRLTFSFFVLAAVFAWEGRKAAQRGNSPTARYVGAAVFTAAGIVALRERHRRE